MSAVKDSYENLIAKRKRRRELEGDVTKLKQDTFGEVTAEEDIATRFFNQLATSTDLIKDTEKVLQEKKSLLEDIKKEEEAAKEAFLRSLTTMKFPLKLGPEGIEKKDNTIAFLFSEELNEDLLEEIRENLEPDCLSSPKVAIQVDRIVAKGFNDVSEAMKDVMKHVETKIWKAASGILEVDKYVSTLKTRDEKIQRMLYVLLEASKPLSKREIEKSAELQPGDLRGVLYVVLKRDAYLREVGRSQYCLTEIGKRIVQKYKEVYGSPFRKETESPRTLKNFVEPKKGGNQN